MTKTRVVAAASVLAVLFALGVSWLVLRATGAPRLSPSAGTGVGTAALTTEPSAETAPSEPAPSGPTPSDPAAGGVGGENSTDPGAPGGGPPKPRGSVQVAGVRLDGNQPEDRCGVVLVAADENLGVPVHIESIALTVTPASVTATLDSAGCTSQSQPLCPGYTFPGGDTSCVFGVRLDSEPPAGMQYSVHARFDLRATCTSSGPVPCNQITGTSPSPAQPIDVTWSGTRQLTVPIYPIEVTETSQPPTATTPAQTTPAETTPAETTTSETTSAAETSSAQSPP